MKYQWKRAGERHWELRADGQVVGSIEHEGRSEWVVYPLWSAATVHRNTEAKARAQLIKMHSEEVSGVAG